jgi:hypothetical protein
MIGYEQSSTQVYATSSWVSFWGISFTQYHILFHPCRQVPLKKETPRWTVLYRITRKLLHLSEAGVLVRKFRRANPAQLS